MLGHRDHVVAPLVGALGHPRLVGTRHRCFPRLHHGLEPQHVREVEHKLHTDSYYGIWVHFESLSDT